MILVTGATGLVGSYLVMQLLEKESQLKAIYRTEKSIQKTKHIFEHHHKLELFQKINWIKADITDVTTLEKAFEGIETAYHCAAFVSFNPNDEEKLQKTNIEGTANIVNFCIDYKVKKICYVSSVAALGDAKEYENSITETSEWNHSKPHSDYAITKHGAEMEVWRASQEGLEIIIINPAVILGYGFWDTNAGQFFDKIYKGFPFYTTGNLPIVAVEDVVNIMIELTNSSIKNEQFIIVADHFSYQLFFELVAKSLHKKLPTIKIPKLVLKIILVADTLISKFLFRQSKLSTALINSLSEPSFYSSEKFQGKFSYAFLDSKNYINELGKKYINDKNKL